MSEKIKEILDYLKIENGTIGSELSYEETHLLLDYITNLQENYERIYNENCKLREEHNITDISLLDENNRLKEENIKLKELCNKYEEEHSTTFQIWKYNKDTYKSRCEKAIDKLYCYGEVFDGKILQQFQKEMLDTLQGVDKVLNILQGEQNE